MGCILVTDVMQPVARQLVFGPGAAHPSTEIRNDGLFPSGPDYSLVYLDGFEYLRRLSQGLLMAGGVGQSAAHRRFEKSCATHGIPLNIGKRIVGELTAGVLGGSFPGLRGWLSLGGG